jgi:hypothetical protein
MQTHRTKLSFGVTLAIAFAVTATVAAADSASNNRRSSSRIAGGGSSGSSSSGSSGFAGGGSGGSRSTSFNEDGKKISITENNSGITITTIETVDGKEKKTEVRAANAKELEAKHPEAYRFYARRLGGTGGASASGGAFASGGGSSHASGRSSSHASGGSGGRSSSSGGKSRSVSFNENGKAVTITEGNDSGITVTISEKIAGKDKKTVVKAANPQQLQKKNAEAYRLYQSHIDGAQGAAGAGQGGAAGSGDAKAMLREQLREQVKQNAGNPQMKEMLEKMLRDLDQ